MKDWNNWKTSIHSEAKQQRKQEKAVSSDCKPLEMHEHSGSFASSDTGEIYSVTLGSCTCISFNRDHLPCKHMYRLAFELGIMSPPAPLQYGYTKPQTLSLFDSISKEAGEFFINICSKPIGEYFKVKDTSELHELANIKFLEFSNDKNAILDVQLSSMKKDELFQLCTSSPDCPKKSSKKQVFIDFIKCHDEISKNVKYNTCCVCISHNIEGLINSIKYAYYKKYPTKEVAYYDF